VVDGNSLENCRAGNGTVGSNPTPSANNETNLAILLIGACEVHSHPATTETVVALFPVLNLLV
jgi:hypothetical protein